MGMATTSPRSVPLILPACSIAYPCLRRSPSPARWRRSVDIIDLESPSPGAARVISTMPSFGGVSPVDERVQQFGGRGVSTTVSLTEVRSLFAPEPGTIYLDTATYGLRRGRQWRRCSRRSSRGRLGRPTGSRSGSRPANRRAHSSRRSSGRRSKRSRWSPRSPPVWHWSPRRCRRALRSRSGRGVHLRFASVLCRGARSWRHGPAGAV